MIISVLLVLVANDLRAFYAIHTGKLDIHQYNFRFIAIQRGNGVFTVSVRPTILKRCSY